MDTEDRVENVEKSIKAIAEYVKKEISEMKKSAPAGLTDLQKIKENIVEEMKYSYAGVKREDLQMIREEVQNKIEELKRGSDHSVVKPKDIDNLREEIGIELMGLHHTLLPKITLLEKKINEVKYSAPSRNIEAEFEYIKERFARDLNEVKKNYSQGIKIQDIQRVKEEIQEDLDKMINKELDVIEKRLESLEHKWLAKAVKAGVIDKGILDDVKDILYS